MANADRWNACVNRLYYACFYAISALFVRDGLSSGSEVRVVKAGDAYLIPRDVPHKVKTLREVTRVLDIFSPPREEYNK